MLAITLTIAIGYLLSLGLFLQERSDLIKRASDLQDELTQAELDIENLNRDIKTLHAIAIQRERKINDISERFAGKGTLAK
tara:strand:- start:346 stop:588 length:243 start_codon:yes stop_codon:yes gene_type:complete